MKNYKMILYLLVAIISILSISAVLALISSVKLDTPADNIYAANQTPGFTFNVTGNVSSYNCTLYIDGTASLTNETVENFTRTSADLNATEGFHMWFVNCTDSDGSMNSTSRNFTVDITYPSLTIISPLTGAYINSTLFSINITANDTNLNYTSISLYNSTGLVNSTTDTTNGNYLVSLRVPKEGIYNMTVITHDLAGNSNGTSVINITVDTTIPNANITPSSTSSGNYTASHNYIEVNVTASDSNLQSVTMYLINAVGSNTSVTNTTGFFNNFTSLSDGNYSYYAIAQDLAGNINTTPTTNNIIVDNTSPSIVYSGVINNSYNKNSSFNITFTATDVLSAVDTCWWIMDNGTTESTTSCINTSVLMNALSSGNTILNHNITIYSNDSLGNTASTFILWGVDTTAPTFTGSITETVTTNTISIPFGTNEATNASVDYIVSGVTHKHVDDTSFSTSHTIVLSSLNANTLYSYTLTIFDRSGNSNSRTNGVYTSAVSGGGGGSGSGGSGSNSGTSSNITLQDIDVSSQKFLSMSSGITNVSFSDSIAYLISVNTTSVANSVKFVVIRSNESTTKYTNGTVYNYITIDHYNVSDSIIGGAKIDFKIAASWLTANHVAKTDIILVRYNNGTWKALPTSLLKSDTSYSYFEAISPGLSTFAISAKKTTTAITNSTPNTLNPTTNSPLSNKTLNVTSNASGNNTQSETNGKSSSVWTWIIIIILVAIIAASIVFFTKKKKSQPWSNVKHNEDFDYDYASSEKKIDSEKKTESTGNTTSNASSKTDKNSIKKSKK